MDTTFGVSTAQTLNDVTSTRRHILASYLHNLMSAILNILPVMQWNQTFWRRSGPEELHLSVASPHSELCTSKLGRFLIRLLPQECGPVMTNMRLVSINVCYLYKQKENPPSYCWIVDTRVLDTCTASEYWDHKQVCVFMSIHAFGHA